MEKITQAIEQEPVFKSRVDKVRIMLEGLRS
jgi:hypothetical protein